MNSIKKKVGLILLVLVIICVGGLIYKRLSKPVSPIQMQTFTKFTNNGNNSHTTPNFVWNGDQYILLDAYNFLSNDNIHMEKYILDERLGILYWEEQNDFMEFRNFVFPDYIYSLKDCPDNKYVVRQSSLVGFKGLYVKSDINFSKLSADDIENIVIKSIENDFTCSDKTVIKNFLDYIYLDDINNKGEKADFLNMDNYPIIIFFSFEDIPALYKVLEIREDDNGDMYRIDFQKRMVYPVSDGFKSMINYYKDM